MIETPFTNFDPVTAILEIKPDDTETRKKISGLLYGWLLNTARKKPVADLATRLEKMRLEIEKLSKVIRIEFLNGKLVVKADGSADMTLRLLQRGTDWFDPPENVASLIIAALPRLDNREYEEKRGSHH